MNETARDSIAAIAITVLRGIRTITKVARPTSAKPNVVPANELKFSFFRSGGVNVRCLRYTGSGHRFKPADKNTKIVYANGNCPHPNQHVFKFENKDKTYLIVATSI